MTPKFQRRCPGKKSKRFILCLAVCCFAHRTLSSHEFGRCKSEGRSDLDYGHRKGMREPLLYEMISGECLLTKPSSRPVR